MKIDSRDETTWYVIYVIVNIFTLGSFWFLRGLITHAIKMAFDN